MMNELKRTIKSEILQNRKESLYDQQMSLKHLNDDEQQSKLKAEMSEFVMKLLTKDATPITVKAKGNRPKII